MSRVGVVVQPVSTLTNSRPLPPPPPCFLLASDLCRFLGAHISNIAEMRILREARASSGCYMVLARFATQAQADTFTHEYNSKPFSSFDSQVCLSLCRFVRCVPAPHVLVAAAQVCRVVYVAGVSFDTGTSSSAAPADAAVAPRGKFELSPGLTELPACPVCLERLDASASGMLTTVCNHTFHCGVSGLPPSCTQLPLYTFLSDAQWPCFAVFEWVERLVLPRVPLLPRRRNHSSGVPSVRPDGAVPHLHATSCMRASRHIVTSPICCFCAGEPLDVSHLWPRGLRALRRRARGRPLLGAPRPLLLCFCCFESLLTPRLARMAQETSHTYSMELKSQRVWDYTGDGYVHRLILASRDGKVVELPDPHAAAHPGHGERSQVPPMTDAVESEMLMQKMDNMSYEYGLLLTSQLEAQREYFDTQAVRACDDPSRPPPHTYDTL